MGQKSYDAVDLAKLIAAIAVVSIHIQPFAEINPLLNTILSCGLARLAVPYFFLATSFLQFHRKGQLSWPATRSYCLRIAKLYGCWFLIMLPMTIRNQFLMRSGTFSAALFRFLRYAVFAGTFKGSWFLTSCIFCTLLLYFLRNHRRLLTGIAVVSYVFCVVASGWGVIIPLLGLEKAYAAYSYWFTVPQTSILAGIPYFVLGRHMAEHWETPKKVNPWAVAAAMLLLLAEVLFVYYRELAERTDCYFMLLPCVYLIFSATLGCKKTFPRAKEMRMTSTVLFFAHVVWIFVIQLGGRLLHVEINNIEFFLMTLILSFMTAIALIALPKRFPKLAFLKNLY